MPTTIDPKGLSLLRNNLWDEALNHFGILHQAYPHQPEHLIEIAKIYFKNRDMERAREYLAKTVQLRLDAPHIQAILEMTNHFKVASEHYYNSDPRFSQDGEWLAFTSAREDTNGDGKLDGTDCAGLYATHLKSQTEIEVVSDEFQNSHPHLSTTLEEVLFLSARRDTNGDGKIDHNDPPGLYIKNLSTGREECLVESKHRPKFPSFSPDHKSVLFCGWHSGAKRCGIYLLNLKDRTTKILHDAFEATYPSFSPDGKNVVFSGWQKDTNQDGQIDLRDNSAIFELELSSGRLNRLVSDTFSNFYPCLSPSGKQMVFLSRRRDTNRDGMMNSLDNSGIYILDEKGFEKTLVPDDRYNKFPVYMADGKQVVYISSWSNPKNPEQAHYFENKGIYMVGIDGFAIREIVSSKHYGCRYLCASPSENKIAYVAWRGDTHRGLYLAEPQKTPSQLELIRLIETNL